MSQYLQYKSSHFNLIMLSFDIGDTMLVVSNDFKGHGKHSFKAILFQHFNNNIMVDRANEKVLKFWSINDQSLYVDEVCHTRMVLVEKYRWKKYFDSRPFLTGGYAEYERLRTKFVKNYTTHE